MAGRRSEELDWGLGLVVCESIGEELGSGAGFVSTCVVDLRNSEEGVEGLGRVLRPEFLKALPGHSVVFENETESQHCERVRDEGWNLHNQRGDNEQSGESFQNSPKEHRSKSRLRHEPKRCVESN